MASSAEIIAAPPLQSIRLDPRDDVGVALQPLAAGIQAEGVTIAAPIPAGHKFALHDIAAGATVHKFGWPIGRATADILAGAHVHSHNVATGLSGLDGYVYEPRAIEALPGATGRTFEGYLRPDGRAGTRNEIWILPTVGCVARTAGRIAAASAEKHRGVVDGVFHFAHPFGCSQLGHDLDATRAMIASLACHPNAGGVLILGLGCEENQLAALMAAIPDEQKAKIRTLGAQMVDDELEAGLALIDELVAHAAQTKRTPVPLSELVIGLKCGGSDGFSGLTANPLVGRVADRVVGAGGSAVLTEIPEVFGAERLLMARAVDEGVFDGIVSVVNDFKNYFIEQGEPISENPSPGNVEGGITTLEEKSLGAVQKAGRGQVVDVLRYGGRLRRHGLTLLEAPGNDAVSSTALSAAGATVILFTTGRGTPMGFPAPTVKIATNSGLAARKGSWIDFDAGAVLADGMETAADALLDTIVAVASGRETASERNGERDIALWKRGVTL